MTNNQGKIWLIGGTQESKAISLQIIHFNLPCVITVTTEDAKQLYSNHPCLTLVVTRLSLEKLECFAQKYNIKAIIDASHPYALEVSQLAIEFAISHHLSYLRYERPCLSYPHEIILDNIETLLLGDYLLNKRGLLTLGYKVLPFFKNWQKKAILYARILPKIESLQVALNSGFTPDRLMAFRPPLDYAMEKALWQHWNIEIVVSKASGKTGGEDLKQKVAQSLNIPLIIIQRPSLNYPQQTSDLEEVKKFINLLSFFK